MDKKATYEDRIALCPGNVGLSVGVIRTLADFPDDAIIDGDGLARALGRCRKTIQRSVRRGELPAPFMLGGRHVWLVSAVRGHFRGLQESALRAATRAEASRARHVV